MSDLCDNPDALLGAADEAIGLAGALLGQAKDVLQARVEAEGEASLSGGQQYPSHAYAWLETVLAALRAGRNWAADLHESGSFGELERDLLLIGFGEYLAQIGGGVPMNQGEIARLSAFGLQAEAMQLVAAEPCALLIRAAEAGGSQQRLAIAMSDLRGGAILGADGLGEELAMVRDLYRRFSADRIEPYAHGWHLADELVPDAIITELADLGTFGLTVPEAYGGSDFGKVAMCVASEELARGFLGVGSLGTRSEIACELIMASGTDQQKQHWLPKIAAGEVLPAAVFTEPNTGSDLGSLTTRAERDGDAWRITGSKTWITHAARADVMTVLARTDPGVGGHRGLSMFLAEKTRATATAEFPDAGIEGDEIEVLGYRGMREFTLSFDGFKVAADGLLGGVEGKGFSQLMRTFESARIQTGARAVGVAVSALELGLLYANERKQFEKNLLSFPRVYRKLAGMAAETCLVRQLTYEAARAKDLGRRCDLEAGMAKLLAARIAWAAADNALQIHGGNGFALAFPVSRVLCDARVLNIFEGAAEIQAWIIARRLLVEQN